MSASKKIVISDYDPAWPLLFEQLQKIYRIHLHDLIEDIQHVGSTSVPGLAAKAKIDCDIIVEDESKIDPVILKLKSLGYQHVGDLGVPGREAFKRKSDWVPFSEAKRKWPAHNLYVCLQGCISLQNHLLFRDFLRSHPAEAKKYSALKRRLAEQYPFDMEAYIDGKTVFITQILAKMGMSKTDLEGIASLNKKKP